ncbi:universal stress protein [Denitratisoma sp. agr-D3]
MAIKNIMVHLDQSPRSELRLTLAVALAKRHQARLVGVFGQRGQAQQVGLVAVWPSPEYAAAAAASKTRFEQLAAGLANAEWQDVNRGSDTEVIRRVVDCARHFDLVIAGQHEEAAALLPKDLVEMLVLDCGRPVLILPYAGEFGDVFGHPMIAWNDAREAARALNDALPLITGAGETVVVRVARDNKDVQADQAAVMAQLAAHGIPSRMRVVVPDSDQVQLMDVLLNSVSDEGATLLVMGAQGHGNSPFSGRGAGTRYVLEHMTVPVLMSH